MSIIIGGRGRLHGPLADLQARLKSLTADLNLLADGLSPAPGRLLSAQVMENWRLAARAAPCLVGRCTGHPILDGPTITTSELWVIAPRQGWARTLSRLYRLGSPAAGEDVL